MRSAEEKAAYKAAWYKRNKSRLAAKQHQYRLDNRDKYKEYLKKYYQRNRITLDAASKAWYAAHPEIVKQYSTTWRKNNPAKHAARQAKRRAVKLQRTPKWLTEQQLLQIAEHYEIAAWATIQFEHKVEVDHIVPLQGENVSGLHVPWNLQAMSKCLNASKSNKLGVS